MAARLAWSKAAKKELQPTSMPRVPAPVAASNHQSDQVNPRSVSATNAIGFGHHGIRFAGVADAHTTILLSSGIYGLPTVCQVRMVAPARPQDLATDEGRGIKEAVAFEHGSKDLQSLSATLRSRAYE
jgi:hypothetical protein